jgi:hypothetical protein
MEVVDPVIKDIHDQENYRFPEFTDTSAISNFRKAHPEACVLAETYGVQDISFTQLWEMSCFMLAMIDHPEIVRDYITSAAGIG